MAPFARSPMNRDQRDFDRSNRCISLRSCSARATERGQDRTVAHGHRSSVVCAPRTVMPAGPAGDEFALAARVVSARAGQSGIGPVRARSPGMPVPFPHRYSASLSRTFASRPELDGDADARSPEHMLLSSLGLCMLTTFEAFATRDGIDIHMWSAKASGTVEPT